MGHFVPTVSPLGHLSVGTRRCVAYGKLLCIGLLHFFHPAFNRTNKEGAEIPRGKDLLEGAHPERSLDANGHRASS